MTIIGLIVAFAVLDGLARWGLIAAVLVFEAVEITVFLRWRKRRATTGPESLEGMTATVVTECDPEGQVKVRGQIWSARARDGATVGEEVVVTGVDGLRLEVSRRATANTGA